MDDRFSTTELREAFFISLYRSTFPAVARYVARMGGSLEEAQDIFQDALVIYYEKATVADNEHAYVAGIAKRLWLQHYRNVAQHQPLNELDRVEEQEEQPVTGRIMRYLETAGKKCMDLLKAHYYDRLPAGSLAKRFGYTSTHTATVAKYKCLEKVRTVVKEKSLAYADFVE